MREDILRILKNICRRKVESQGQSINFDQTFTFCIIGEENENIMKIIFLETREIEENFDIKIMIFREELDLLCLFFQNQ